MCEIQAQHSLPVDTVRKLNVLCTFNLRPVSTGYAIKIKLFVAREIQYFELGIFSFSSYIYYLNRGFLASTRAFSLSTRAFSSLTGEFELATCGFELVTREFELVTCGSELVTRALLFHG